jgi:ribosomal protein S26
MRKLVECEITRHARQEGTKVTRYSVERRYYYLLYTVSASIHFNVAKILVQFI